MSLLHFPIVKLYLAEDRGGEDEGGGGETSEKPGAVRDFCSRLSDLRAIT